MKLKEDIHIINSFLVLSLLMTKAGIPELFSFVIRHRLGGRYKQLFIYCYFYPVDVQLITFVWMPVDII